MRVVCGAKHVVSLANSLAAGLYCKLHGVHRPVNLSKPTIKRRKRIVTATPAGSSKYLQESAPGSDSPLAYATNLPMSADNPDESVELDQAQSVHRLDEMQSARKMNRGRNPSGQPARKKARKALGTVTAASGSSTSPPPMSDNLSVTDEANLSSARSEHLTLPELAAVAALAMHSNHERSLEHSTRLDTALLDAHSHPLHLMSDAPLRAATDPLDVNEGSTPNPHQEQHPIAHENHLQVLRDELARECALARDTISRLQAFVSRSEVAMQEMDRRSIEQRCSCVTSPTKHIRNAPTLLPQPSPSSLPQSQAIHNGDVTLDKSALSTALERVPLMDAIPSRLLQHRKKETAELRSRRRLIWEICPSNALGIVIVPIKQEQQDYEMMQV